MIEDLIALALPPGLVNNGTAYQTKGRWHVGNLVRFFQQTIQPIGGWVQRVTSGASIVGTPNACIAWQLNDGTSWLAIGTSSNLYIVSSANVVTDITPTTGLSGGPPYLWQLDTFGSYLVAGYNAPSTLAADNFLPNYDGITYYAWTGSTGTVAQSPRTPTLIPDESDQPSAPFGLFTTPERFFVLVRGSDPVGMTVPPDNIVDGVQPSGTGHPNYSVRRVYWATQETITDWKPAATNSCGSFDIATDGSLVCGHRTKTASLVWSTTDLWSMTYIGQPFIYSFRQEGTNCGIISQHAAVIIDTGAYWMANGKFFLFNGFVKPIPCDVTDYVFGNFNQSLASTVWAIANPLYNEVTWFYPSASAVSTPDRYVTYNYIEGHWTFGTLGRCCGVTRWPGVTTGPVMVDAAGAIYEHESGSSHSGGTPFIESGPVEMGNGDRVMRIQRVVPDDKTQGDVTASLYTSFFPDTAETLNGPYTLASPTSVRLTARQVRVRLTEAAATAWRVGVVRLGIILGGRR